MPGQPVQKKTKTRRQLWEDNYDQVFEYAKRTGNLNLPTNDAETARLAGWLGRQKKRKDISNAEREKLAALQQYGYVDDYNRGVQDEVAWNEYFDQLIEYRRVVGRKVVSKKDCPKLSEWAARQRKMEKTGQTVELSQAETLEDRICVQEKQAVCQEEAIHGRAGEQLGWVVRPASCIQGATWTLHGYVQR
jgi:hypothetical protein